METNTTVTVSQILDRYERECVPLLEPRTQKDYARHVRHLQKAFGHLDANALEPRDFGPFLQVQKGKWHRVRQLAVLSAAFSQAVSFWYVMKHNVLRDVKRPKARPRDRLIEQHEFDAVLAIAPLRVRLMMRLALKIGQRQGDLLNLKWSQIKGMEIHLQQGKTGKRLAIGIDAELEKLLDECWRLPKGGCDGGEYVITRKIGNRYTSEGFRALWQRTINKYCRRPGSVRYSFHDIRAMCATRCPTLEYASSLLGHATTAMTRKVYRRGIERVQALPSTSP